MPIQLTTIKIILRSLVMAIEMCNEFLHHAEQTDTTKIIEEELLAISDALTFIINTINTAKEKIALAESEGK